MDQRVSLVTLGVTDLARAAALSTRMASAGSETANGRRRLLPAAGLRSWRLAAGVACRGRRHSAAGSGFSGIALAFNARSQAEVDAVLARRTLPAQVPKPVTRPFGADTRVISPIPTAMCGRLPTIRGGRSMRPAGSQFPRCRPRADGGRRPESLPCDCGLLQRLTAKSVARPHQTVEPDALGSAIRCSPSTTSVPISSAISRRTAIRRCLPARWCRATTRR